MDVPGIWRDLILQVMNLRGVLKITYLGSRYKLSSSPSDGDRGSTVVKVLCYKSEGRWFDSRWLPVRKADNLTTIMGHCHVKWEPELPGTLWATRACNGTDLPYHQAVL